MNKLFVIEQIESGSIVNRVTINGDELYTRIRQINNRLIREGYQVFGSIREGFEAKRINESIFLEVESF